VKIFVELGAETLIQNVYGKTPLHIAAECGFESILVYLCRELHMDFSSTDINGRTPLHIAALEGQINTGILLISWSDDLNIQDIEGFTPLHLAALSQNYKLVRNLIIRDADVSCKDFKNETAFDIALNRGAPDIIKLLKPATCIQRLNPFYTHIDSAHNSYIKFMIYILLFIFRAGLTIVVIMPHLNKILSLSAASILILTGFAFIVVSNKDPGYTKNNKNLSLLTLYETYRSEYICAYCETRKPKFSRHCHYCERCVKVNKT
jgi:ankyrin repeat protein